VKTAAATSTVTAAMLRQSGNRHADENRRTDTDQKSFQ
jgi:hypothetical protein